MSLEPLGQLVGHKAPVGSLSVAADGVTALSSSEDGTIRLWDLRTHRSVRAVRVAEALGERLGVESALGCCAFVDPGEPTWALVAAAGPRLLIFDLRASTQVIVAGPAAASASLIDDINDFAVTVGLLAAPLDTGEIALLSLPELRLVRMLGAGGSGHGNIVGCCRFRAGGSELFTGGFDKQLAFWDPRNGKLRQKLDASDLLPPEEPGGDAAAPTLNPPFVLSLAVGPGEELGVGLGDGSVLALAAGRLPKSGLPAPWAVVRAHAHAADCVAWLGGSPKPLLCSAGRDRALRLWAPDTEGGSRSSASSASGRRRGGRSSAATAAADDEEVAPPVGLGPVASLALEEKPSALAAGTGEELLLADTAGHVTLIRARR